LYSAAIALLNAGSSSGAAVTDYWAKAPLGRGQTLLFYPALDQQIPADHPVRLLDEVLHQMDWSAREGEYNGRIGRPPIPPRVLAGAILCGLMRGIRGSRQLEYLCGNALDFLWLANEVGFTALHCHPEKV
jgi:transposase